MNKAIGISLLLCVVSVAARRGGGVSVSGASDNWDAPPEMKAIMAFYIIWCLVSLGQLSLLIKNLKFVPTMAARAPYIMLTVLTAMLAFLYLIWAIYERLSTDAEVKTLDGLASVINFFISFETSFRPGVVLYIAHQKAALLRASLGKSVAPLASQFWKRILDWVLVAIVCLLGIVQMAILTNEDQLINNGGLSYQAYRHYRDAVNGFAHAQNAMVIILTIDVFVTLLTLLIVEKRWRFKDPVIVRLLALAFPFLAAYAIEWLVIDIYTSVAPYDYLALGVATTILDGIIRIASTAAITSTMTMPGVQWTPSAPPPAVGQPYVQPNQYQYPSFQPGWGPSPPMQYPQQPYPQQPYPPQQPQQPPQPYTIPMNVNHN